MFYVYFLRRLDKPDPLETGFGCPFYVGKGSNGRYLSHRKEAIDLLCKPGRKTYKISIIHNLWKQNLDFTEDIFCNNLTEEEAFELEKEVIQAYGRKDNGTGILANLTNGGDGPIGWIPTDETKERMRKANLGKKHTPETIEKMRQANLGQIPWIKGKKHTPETIEKIKQMKTGKKASPETIEKMRQANLGENNYFFGKKHTPETIEKMRKAKLGKNNPNFKKKKSPETIEKLRQANKGKKPSPETIEKMRQAHLGKKLSPETIEKVRQATILRWEKKRERQEQMNLSKKGPYN